MDLQELKEINKRKLNNYLEQNKNEQIEKEIIIHKKIEDLLNNNENIFFQISMDDAFKILSKLVPIEDIKNVYAELVSGKNFEDLRKRFKL